MKKNLYVLYAMALLQGMVFYGPIATLYRQAQGVTVFEITVIESISLALCILLEIPWGMIADKIGYRKTMIFCSFLYFISKIVFWQATGVGGGPGRAHHAQCGAGRLLRRRLQHPLFILRRNGPSESIWSVQQYEHGWAADCGSSVLGICGR